MVHKCQQRAHSFFQTLYVHHTVCERVHRIKCDGRAGERVAGPGGLWNGMMGFWKVKCNNCGVLFVIAFSVSIVAAGLLGLHKPLLNGCIMTYMYPTYIPIPRTLATTTSSSSKEKYGLYLYHEGWKKIDYQLHLVNKLCQNSGPKPIRLAHCYQKNEAMEAPQNKRLYSSSLWAHLYR
jgi:hypothetical protein